MERGVRVLAFVAKTHAFAYAPTLTPTNATPCKGRVRRRPFIIWLISCNCPKIERASAPVKDPTPFPDSNRFEPAKRRADAN